jgi:hypothetical protein
MPGLQEIQATNQKMDSYLKLQSIVDNGKLSNLIYLVLWFFMMLTKIQGISIIDVATRWVELCPYTSKRSEDIALLVDQNWFCRYPRPIAIFDNGSEFSVRVFGITPQLWRYRQIKNLQTNVFVERIHQVISSSIRAVES